MSLVTRCPRCRTLFRVTPDQLQARSGRVRCGRCMNAFDAYDALAAETTNILPPPQQRVAEPVAAQNALKLDLGSPPQAPEAATAAAVAPTAPNPSPEPPKTTAAETAYAPHPMPEPAAAAAITEIAAQPEREPEPSSRFAEVFTHPTPQQLWRVGAGALAVVLLLQIAYAYRSELVARSPMLRSALSGLCEHAGCRVPLPQRPELVRIEASDVHMVDAARPQLVQLTATLRSHAAYDLAYPALDLVLTNANEHALARRIFRPDEYLDATRDPDAGIPANAEITVALDLDTGDLNAAGFRLDLLAAPPR
jgi:predicted Zn finger-like uncharacterized protein